jgi:hypothetical protein
VVVAGRRADTSRLRRRRQSVRRRSAPRHRHRPRRHRGRARAGLRRGVVRRPGAHTRPHRHDPHLGRVQGVADPPRQPPRSPRRARGRGGPHRRGGAVWRGGARGALRSSRYPRRRGRRLRRSAVSAARENGGPRATSAGTGAGPGAHATARAGTSPSTRRGSRPSARRGSRAASGGVIRARADRALRSRSRARAGPRPAHGRHRRGRGSRGSSCIRAAAPVGDHRSVVVPSRRPGRRIVDCGASSRESRCLARGPSDSGTHSRRPAPRLRGAPRRAHGTGASACRRGTRRHACGRIRDVATADVRCRDAGRHDGERVERAERAGVGDASSPRRRARCPGVARDRSRGRSPTYAVGSRRPRVAAAGPPACRDGRRRSAPYH